MESIDNDFAHNRNLRSDCNNSLHMPQSWVVMACAKIFSKVYPRWQFRNNFDFSSDSNHVGKMFGKISPQDIVKRMSCWQHRPEDCDVLAGRRQMMIGKLGLYAHIVVTNTMLYRWRSIGLLIRLGVRIVWARVTWTKNVGLRSGNTSSALV